MEITKQTNKAPILRELPSRLLGQTAALVGRVVSEVLAAQGAHRYQFAVLATLEAFGNASQAELCRRTDIDRSDMNATLNALEEQGYVQRTIDTGNRRQNIVALTGSGTRRFNALRKQLEAANKQALAPLSAGERAELVRLLQCVHDHLAPSGQADAKD